MRATRHHTRFSATPRTVAKPGGKFRPAAIPAQLVIASLLGSATLIGLPSSVLADETRYIGGLRGGVMEIPAGRNTEEDLTGQNDPGAAGFSISVDGERVAGARPPKHAGKRPTIAADIQDANAQRQADVDLTQVDLQVKFDGLGVKPRLNVATIDLRHSFGGGEEITFVATTNYPGWIERAEVVIREVGFTAPKGPIARIEVVRGRATWQMPVDGSGRYTYTLRVYDHLGRYDETHELGLSRSSRELPTHRTAPGEVSVSPGDGEDRTARRNIPVFGGAVTVFGRHVPLNARAFALGQPIPVDPDGSFVTQQILPPGQHAIDVKVVDPFENDVAITRDIHIPDNEWFYVGLADLTVGRRLGDRALRETEPGEFEKIYAKGRLAFYLKGKIQGRYLLTAAADTQEDDIENIFRGLDSKDPRQLLRRIDPDKYYPVYGDDSEILEDAPTNGKFYVRLERGDSHVLWGNFKTRIDGTEFARSERGLYGAHAKYRSEETTSYGERKYEAEAYASQPGTLPQRDVMRGTGGSSYFLSRQDLTQGSETVTIEVRDPVTGIVRSRQALRYGEDYQIDYIQGVIILEQPLFSTVRYGPIVQNNPLGDDQQSLVVQYEYTPALGETDGYSYGGRGQAWVLDQLRVGVTGIKEEAGPVDQQLASVDLRLQIADNSYLHGEIAQSEGPGFGRSTSSNGGLTITETASAGQQRKTAHAGRVELKVDLADISSLRGSVGGYFDRREGGFSSIDYDNTVTQRTAAAHATIEVTDTYRYLFYYEDFENKDGVSRRQGDAEIEFEFIPGWTIGMAYKHTHAINDTQIEGEGTRHDLGLRLTYKDEDDLKAYGFMHASVAADETISKNNRAGLGAEVRVTEKIWLQGEVSNGTTGWGGLAGIKYDQTPDDHYYMSYRLDPERSLTNSSTLFGTDMGTIVMGSRTRYTDELSGYAENSYDIFGLRRSLATTYGVVYTPSALWTLRGGIEHGDVKDANNDDIRRTAVSSSVGYNEEKRVAWKLKGEMRFENSQNPAQDRDTFLVSSQINVRRNANWRVLANIDAAFSNSNQADVLDGDYVEASLGAAYRPIDNDRWNVLFKYTYLYDLPGIDQVTVSGSTEGPAQRSHIVSADVSYQMNNYVTLGGKYGARIGEVSVSRESDDFVRSSAHLGVLRADLHVVHNWDLLLEGRVLHTPEIETTQTGFLAAVYRHLGANMKVGIGYNFGTFSDDLSDLTFDDEGVFLNIVGKL
ncbi:MAG: TonB-dependent receptor [Pseudomonadota bacterium]